MAAEVQKQYIKLFFKIPDLLKPNGGTTTRTMNKSNPLLGFWISVTIVMNQYEGIYEINKMVLANGLASIPLN